MSELPISLQKMLVSASPSLSEKTTNTTTSLASESQSTCIEVPAVDFVDYIENARITREEQSAANSNEDNYALLHHLRSYLLTRIPCLASIVPKLCKLLGLSEPEDDSNAWPDRNNPRFSTNEHRPGSNRTASWIGVFFLMTSVVSAPNWTVYIFANCGFVLAIFFEIGFAAAAYFASWSLWQIFLSLDSYRYPVKTYQDLAKRIFGKWVGGIVRVIQSIDILLAIGITILTAAGTLNVLAANLEVGRICYPVACLIITVVIICLTEVRLLHSFKWIAMISFLASLLRFGIALGTSWRVDTSINVLITNFQYAGPITPVKPIFHYPGAYVVPFGGLVQPWASGMSNTQMSFWGNNVFTEFMAEMRDVKNFRRALRWAWTWFLIQRILVGIVVYAQQGQYSAVDPFVRSLVTNEHGIKPLVATANILQILFLTIQAAVLANIALKVIFRGTLSKVGMTTRWNARRISILWAIAAPIYLAIVYLLAMCLPHYDAIYMMFFPIGWGFTAYGLPPLLYLGYCFRMYKLLPKTGPTDTAVRRNAMNLEPSNPWLTNAKMQRLLCSMAALVLLVSLIISAEEMWEAVTGLLYNLKNAPIVSKVRITSCEIHAAI